MTTAIPAQAERAKTKSFNQETFPFLPAAALYFLAGFAALLCARPTASACTTFLLRQTGEGPSASRFYVGKNYDWKDAAGHVLFNKRGVTKRALILRQGGIPARWKSQHASITFNQYGREMPNGGMNDAGLIVEIMWLDESRFPPPDKRPTVNEVQWIQYQLDSFSTVAEAVDAAKQIRPHRVYAKVHYLMCDRRGSCAAVEYLNGRLMITAGEDLSTPVLTNDRYAPSLQALKKNRNQKNRSLPQGSSSLARFVRAATLIRQERAGANPVSRSFAILDNVRNGDYTKWQIVYDLHSLRVYWRSLDAEQIKTVSLHNFPAECPSPVTWLSINHRKSGDVQEEFSPWTIAANLDLLEQSMARIVKSLPPGSIEKIAAYPDQLVCSLDAVQP